MTGRGLHTGITFSYSYMARKSRIFGTSTTTVHDHATRHNGHDCQLTIINCSSFEQTFVLIRETCCPLAAKADACSCTLEEYHGKNQSSHLKIYRACHYRNRW